MNLLDTFSDKYLKKLAGLPRGATNALLHLKEGVDCQSISSLYMETHTISHTRTRLQGDIQVNHVLDTTPLSESKLSAVQNKLRTTSLSEKTFRDVMDMSASQGDPPITAKFNNNVQTCVNNTIRHQDQSILTEHVKKLTLQGNTLALGAAQQEDVIWKSYMFNLKAGTL